MDFQEHKKMLLLALEIGINNFLSEYMKNNVMLSQGHDIVTTYILVGLLAIFFYHLLLDKKKTLFS